MYKLKVSGPDKCGFKTPLQGGGGCNAGGDSTSLQGATITEKSSYLPQSLGCLREKRKKNGKSRATSSLIYHGNFAKLSPANFWLFFLNFGTSSKEAIYLAMAKTTTRKSVGLQCKKRDVQIATRQQATICLELNTVTLTRQVVASAQPCYEL